MSPAWSPNSSQRLSFSSPEEISSCALQTAPSSKNRCPHQFLRYQKGPLLPSPRKLGQPQILAEKVSDLLTSRSSSCRDSSQADVSRGILFSLQPKENSGQDHHRNAQVVSLNSQKKKKKKKTLFTELLVPPFLFKEFVLQGILLLPPLKIDVHISRWIYQKASSSALPSHTAAWPCLRFIQRRKRSVTSLTSRSSSAGLSEGKTPRKQPKSRCCKVLWQISQEAWPASVGQGILFSLQPKEKTVRTITGMLRS